MLLFGRRAVFGTPRPTLPPGTKPAWATHPRAVTKHELAGIHVFRDATSIWLLGGVPNAAGTEWYELYLYTLEGGEKDDTDATVAMILLTGPADLREPYDQSWESPRPIKQMTTTSVTGVTLVPGGASGIVTFTTESGQRGDVRGPKVEG